MDDKVLAQTRRVQTFKEKQAKTRDLILVKLPSRIYLNSKYPGRLGEKIEKLYEQIPKLGLVKKCSINHAVQNYIMDFLNPMEDKPKLKDFILAYSAIVNSFIDITEFAFAYTLCTEPFYLKSLETIKSYEIDRLTCEIAETLHEKSGDNMPRNMAKKLVNTIYEKGLLKL